MASILQCFSWLVDVYLAFIISFVVAGTFLIAFWCLWKWLHTKMFFIRWRFKFECWTTRWRVLSMVSTAGVLAAPVVIKAYNISADEPMYMAEVTDIVPSLLLFFQQYTNWTYNVYTFTLPVNKLFVYGSLVLFVPLCFIVLVILVDKEQKVVHYGLVSLHFFNRSLSKNRAEFVESYVLLEAKQKDLYQRLNIASQVYNMKQREISDLTTEVVYLNYKLQMAIEKNKELEKEKKKPRRVKVTQKDPEQEKRYAELQTRHTELMRKYYKLDKKYSELAKQQREQENSPTTPSPTYKPENEKAGLKGDDELCVICMEQKRQYILKPCNHYCVCNDCKRTLKNKCPVCRKNIQKYEKLYVA